MVLIPGPLVSPLPPAGGWGWEQREARTDLKVSVIGKITFLRVTRLTHKMGSLQDLLFAQRAFCLQDSWCPWPVTFIMSLVCAVSSLLVPALPIALRPVCQLQHCAPAPAGNKEGDNPHSSGQSARLLSAFIPLSPPGQDRRIRVSFH
jgi:hypothetical protein